MVELQAEFRKYQDRLPSMLAKHNGDFVVIKGDQPMHFFPTYEAALNWAYEAFGLDRFFVRRVTEDLAAAHYTRDLGPCQK